MVRRVGRMTPRIAWANPVMAGFFLAAWVGSFALLILAPGWLVGVRLAAEVLAWVMCVRGNRFVALPAVLAALLLAVSGHAAAVLPQAAGAEFADAVHVLSAAMWAGGILALLTLRPPHGWGAPEARVLLERFGRVAFIAFGVAALTGLLSASEHLNGLSDLWKTTYGLVLDLKIAGIAIMVGLSLLWRRGIVAEGVEAVVVVLVILATALLAVLPSPA